jgi:hypothetical protein
MIIFSGATQGIWIGNAIHGQAARGVLMRPLYPTIPATLKSSDPSRHSHGRAVIRTLTMDVHEGRNLQFGHGPVCFGDGAISVSTGKTRCSIVGVHCRTRYLIC